ncbi:MAG: oligopeptide transporter, OPT family [Planctomycetes bacterium]|nr:oligopeptide transporter, OPT family [Planctomycetota bacterium]
MREFTPLSILLGVIIGILFGAANAYIGMKVGMTVSASIPAAVISMAILRGLLKRGTLLENNMVQTIGSVGESLAAGMIFTIPALFIFSQIATNNANDLAAQGLFEESRLAAEEAEKMLPAFLEMTVWGAVGGLLGVLFMVPLRRMLIVKEHKTLPYPEGTACAGVLKSGERGGASAKTVFTGLGVGAVYEFVRGLGFWKDEAVQRLPLLKTDFALATEPALLGVGYILGSRIAGYMLGGAVLGWFVIIPAIAMFGASATEPIAPETTLLISQMDPGLLWTRYLRFIGAGAVVLGGILALLRSLGTIGRSVFHMFGGGGTGERTDRDIPTWILFLLLIGLGAAMWYFPQIHLQKLAVIVPVIVFAFFFVTVSSRLVGIVGSSSNPASGMTIATLLGTALIAVYLFDMTGATAKFAIISVGALVCIAICVAGDCSQDLKTGFLLKATPWKQQVGEIVGILTATAAIAGVVWLCNDTYGFFKDADHPNALLAPQANLMKLVVEGIVDRHLPWELILAGMAAALVVEMLGVPSLPFAVGLYLPLSLSTPIMVGGLLNWGVNRKRRKKKEIQADDHGILAASGLVAGQGLVGVLFVAVAATVGWLWHDPIVHPAYPASSSLFTPKYVKDWTVESLGIDHHYGLDDVDIVASAEVSEELHRFTVTLEDVGADPEAVAVLIREARLDLHHYEVVLTEIGGQELIVSQVLSELRRDLSDIEVEDLMNALPASVLKDWVGEEGANTARDKLKMAGATVELPRHDEVKEFLQRSPVRVLIDISPEEAEQWRSRFEDAGATVTVKSLIVRWYDILPLLPFMLLVIWLAWAASKRSPETPVVSEASSPGPATGSASSDRGVSESIQRRLQGHASTSGQTSTAPSPTGGRIGEEHT